jgi:sensor histidine kinase YesM
MSNKTLYWICQGIGWGLYMLFSIAMMFIFSNGSDWTRGTIILQVVLLISLAVFSHAYRNYIKGNEWSLLSIKQLIPRVLLGVIITSLAVQIFVHVLIYFVIPLDGILPFSWPSFFGYTFSVSLVMALWSTIYFAYQFVQRNRRSEMEKLVLTAALNEAELAILKNQINPHFLFNALNNIRSLILSDPEKARTMVTHISE